MTSQNPAQAPVNPSEDERVQPARPAAGAVEERATIRRRRRPTSVYFIHAPQSGRLKIGIAVDPVSRFSSLKTGSGEPLVLLGWSDYSEFHPAEVRSLESELHACFAPWRLEGEWFQALPDILQFAYEARDPGTSPEERYAPPPVVEHDMRRPAIPANVDAPKGNGRKAILARYKLARGIT